MSVGTKNLAESAEDTVYIGVQDVILSHCGNAAGQQSHNQQNCEQKSLHKSSNFFKIWSTMLQLSNSIEKKMICQ